MFSVTVNYDEKQREQYFATIEGVASVNKQGLLVIAIMLLVISPLLVWFCWHRQWLSLALLGVLFFYTLWCIRGRARANIDRLISDHPPQRFTLLPEGLRVTSNKGYTFRAWPRFEPPVSSAAGLSMKYAGDDSQFFIPHASFASAENYDEFAAQTLRFYTAAESTTVKLLPNVREPAPNPRYILDYQLPAEMIDISSAVSEELKQKFPHTIPPEKEMSTWQAWIVRFLFCTTIVFFFDIHSDEVRTFDYLRATGLVIFLNFLFVILLFLAAARILPRWKKTTSMMLPKFLVTLSEDGLHRAQPGFEYFVSWSSYDAVLHHAGLVTLWRHGTLQEIIPDFAFATPEDSSACAEWILQKITQNNTPLPVADLANNKPFPPDTDNPYQAPRYS